MVSAWCNFFRHGSRNLLVSWHFSICGNLCSRHLVRLYSQRCSFDFVFNSISITVCSFFIMNVAYLQTCSVCSKYLAQLFLKSNFFNNVDCKFDKLCIAVLGYKVDWAKSIMVFCFLYDHAYWFKFLDDKGCDVMKEKILAYSSHYFKLYVSSVLMLVATVFVSVSLYSFRPDDLSFFYHATNRSAKFF